jgi:hypothetical protein
MDYNNVLIALSTFIVGLIITQNKLLISVDSVAILFAMVGVVTSMLFSFVIGFTGMVRDSMEKRVLSWVLLLTCFVSYMFTMLAFIANYLFRPSIVVSLISVLLGAVLFFIQVYFSKRFTKWLESKLSSLLGETVDEWKNIGKKVVSYVFYIIAISLTVTIIIVILGHIF